MEQLYGPMARLRIGTPQHRRLAPQLPKAQTPITSSLVSACLQGAIEKPEPAETGAVMQTQRALGHEGIDENAIEI